jgi:hypothetical protein
LDYKRRRSGTSNSDDDERVIKKPKLREHPTLNVNAILISVFESTKASDDPTPGCSRTIAQNEQQIPETSETPKKYVQTFFWKSYEINPNIKTKC